MRKHILTLILITFFSSFALQASDKWRDRITAIENSKVQMIKELWADAYQLNQKSIKLDSGSSEKVILQEKVKVLLIKIDHALVDENPENINSVTMVKLMPWNERLVAIKKSRNKKIQKMWKNITPITKKLKDMEFGTEEHQESSAKLNVTLIQIDKLLVNESNDYKRRFNGLNNIPNTTINI